MKAAKEKAVREQETQAIWARVLKEGPHRPPPVRPKPPPPASTASAAPPGASEEEEPPDVVAYRVAKAAEAATTRQLHSLLFEVPSTAP